MKKQSNVTYWRRRRAKRNIKLMEKFPDEKGAARAHVRNPIIKSEGVGTFLTKRKDGVTTKKHLRYVEVMVSKGCFYDPETVMRERFERQLRDASDPVKQPGKVRQLEDLSKEEIAAIMRRHGLP